MKTTERLLFASKNIWEAYFPNMCPRQIKSPAKTESPPSSAVFGRKAETPDYFPDYLNNERSVIIFSIKSQATWEFKGPFWRTNVTESGMGQRTNLAKMVAEIMKVPFDRVEMTPPETKINPTGFGLCGSRGPIPRL